MSTPPQINSMQNQIRIRRFLSLYQVRGLGPAGALLAATVVALCTGCGTTRLLQIESVPPGATVSLNGHSLGSAPVKTEATWDDDKTIVEVSVQREGYESVLKTLTAREAQAATEPWRLSVELAPL